MRRHFRCSRQWYALQGEVLEESGRARYWLTGDCRTSTSAYFPHSAITHPPSAAPLATNAETQPSTPLSVQAWRPPPPTRPLAPSQAPYYSRLAKRVAAPVSDRRLRCQKKRVAQTRRASDPFSVSGLLVWLEETFGAGEKRHVKCDATLVHCAAGEA